MAQRIVYWFRNDLRLNDNEALHAAASLAQEIIPVYVFDPRQFEPTRLGFRRTGALRAKFVIECVTDLRSRLREQGGDLLVRIGEPEKIIAQLAETYGADYVFTSKEIAPEETRIESSLSKKLKISNVDIKLFWMDTLNCVADLPFPISKLPMGFENFSIKVKTQLQINTNTSLPDKIVLPADFDAGIMPSLPMLGIDPQEIADAKITSASITRGGETMALAALDKFAQAYSNNYPDSVSQDPFTDSQLTNWLSMGCISARTIYNTINDKVQSTAVLDGLVRNLLQRDYFHLTLLRYGPRLFKPSGIKHNFEQKWLWDQTLFETWKDGETDDPAVNEIMRKLLVTGDLSFAERELASLYLIKKLQVVWTWGAMYFESFLIDYDVSVNWGRWNNLAGVGAD